MKKYSYQLLSSLKLEKNEYMNLLEELYKFTRHLEKDYKGYEDWFWKKQIKGLENQTREIIIAYNENEISGIAFLKNDEEKKIATLFVHPNHRGKGIATNLIELSFNVLSTNTPVITLSANKMGQFKKIIEKYNWKITDTISKGYYNNEAEEYVFNEQPKIL